MSLFEENRWLQRFQNYQRALTQLDNAIKSTEDKGIDEFSDLEIQGTIKCFEMVFDLAWKTLQDYNTEQGYELKGPKNSIQQAFKDNLIKDGEQWEKILEKIRTSYYFVFDDLDKVLTRIKNNG